MIQVSKVLKLARCFTVAWSARLGRAANFIFLYQKDGLAQSVLPLCPKPRLCFFKAWCELTITHSNPRHHSAKKPEADKKVKADEDSAATRKDDDDQVNSEIKKQVHNLVQEEIKHEVQQELEKETQKMEAAEPAKEKHNDTKADNDDEDWAQFECLFNIMVEWTRLDFRLLGTMLSNKQAEQL